MMTGKILGCVLAGGQSRRMGRDKAFVPLAGHPLVAHAIARLRPQTDHLAVSFNGDASAMKAFGLPVLADTIPGFQGPLAGLLAALEHAHNLEGVTHIATAAADSPFFPDTLVETLVRQAPDDSTPVLAASSGRIHPVFGLFPIGLADDLRDWLPTAEKRAVRAWTDRHGAQSVRFPSRESHDPFFNVNTEDDLAEARHRISAMRQDSTSG